MFWTCETWTFITILLSKKRKISRWPQGVTDSNSTTGVKSYLKFLISKVSSLPLFTERLHKATNIGFFSKYRKKRKKSFAGNWTPIFWVWSRCANHYTMKAHMRKTLDRRNVNFWCLGRICLCCHCPYIPRPLWYVSLNRTKSDGGSKNSKKRRTSFMYIPYGHKISLLLSLFL